MTQLFTVGSDGSGAMRLSLPGKPDPAMVFEDDAAGVSIAAHGGYEMVVGVHRSGAGAQLAEVGADVMETDRTRIPGMSCSSTRC